MYSVSTGCIMYNVKTRQTWVSSEPSSVFRICDMGTGQEDSYKTPDWYNKGSFTLSKFSINICRPKCQIFNKYRLIYQIFNIIYFLLFVICRDLHVLIYILDARFKIRPPLELQYARAGFHNISKCSHNSNKFEVKMK